MPSFWQGLDRLFKTFYVFMNAHSKGVHFSYINQQSGRTLWGEGDRLTPHTPSPSYSSVRGLAKTHLAPAPLGSPPCPLDASLKLMYAGANTPLKAVKQTSSVWLMYTD